MDPATATSRSLPANYLYNIKFYQILCSRPAVPEVGKPGGRRHTNGLARPPIDRPRLAHRGPVPRKSDRPPTSRATTRALSVQPPPPTGGREGLNLSEGGEARAKDQAASAPPKVPAAALPSRVGLPSRPSRPRVPQEGFEPTPPVHHRGRAVPRTS